MKLPSAKLGYIAAGTTILVATLVPFLLMGVFTRAVTAMGLHVDEMYSGGPKVRTIQFGGYAVDVHRPVEPHMLQREKPFVQLAWRPISALPGHISDTLDVDGDGQPDVRVTFDMPKDANMPLQVNVQSFNPRFESMQNVRKQKFSSLIVRVDDAILVRIPVVQRQHE